MDTGHIGELILFLGLAITSFAYAHMGFRNWRLKQRIEALEAERESLIHHVEVQREMLISRLSPETEKKVTEAAGYMAEVFSLALGLQHRIRAHKMEREKKGNTQA